MAHDISQLEVSLTSTLKTLLIVITGNTLYTLLELTSKLAAVHTFPLLPVPPTRLTSVHTVCITDTGYHVGSGNSATRTQRILP